MTARSFVTREERQAVEKAIAGAEARTSAEVVCAVATESGRYDRAGTVVGLLLSLFGLWLANVAVVALSGGDTTWEAPQAYFGWQAIGSIVGFAAGNVIATTVRPIRRLLAGDEAMARQTERAAAHVFYTQRLASTRTRGGLLIYVSLLEREVVVLADEGARGAIDENGLAALRDLARSKLQSGDRVGTFVATTRVAADRLSTTMPPNAIDGDELPNALRLYHPRP
jgi:putative membrane protein